VAHAAFAGVRIGAVAAARGAPMIGNAAAGVFRAVFGSTSRAIRAAGRAVAAGGAAALKGTTLIRERWMAPRIPKPLAGAAAVVLVAGAVATRVPFPKLLGGLAPRTVAVTRAAETGTETGAPRRAQLSVTSEPQGAAVVVDGRSRGRTPLVVDDLAAGSHTITLTHDAGSVQRVVKLKDRERQTLDVPIYSGWVALFAPLELEISDGGRRLTLDDQNRLMLPPGRHELEVVNTRLGFRSSQSVTVRPGEVTAVSIAPPKTTVVITSTQPAEVWVDGVRMGDTPLDVRVEIGAREFVFRNAEFGERRMATTVTVEPAHISVDFTRPT
jgi:hypothetical protein